jgi:hypothetical protein
MSDLSFPYHRLRRAEELESRARQLERLGQFPFCVLPGLSLVVASPFGWEPALFGLIGSAALTASAIVYLPVWRQRCLWQARDLRDEHRAAEQAREGRLTPDEEKARERWLLLQGLLDQLRGLQ